MIWMDIDINAVIEETMRVRHLGTVLWRDTAEEASLAGTPVHPGVKIFWSPWILNHGEQYWGSDAREVVRTCRGKEVLRHVLERQLRDRPTSMHRRAVFSGYRKMHGRKFRESLEICSRGCIEFYRYGYGDWVQSARVLLQSTGRLGAPDKSGLMPH